MATITAGAIDPVATKAIKTMIVERKSSRNRRGAIIIAPDLAKAFDLPRAAQRCKQDDKLST